MITSYLSTNNLADDGYPLMTEQQFQFLLQQMHKGLADRSIRAAKGVLVDGRQQKEVAKELGIKEAQVSENVALFRRRFAEFCEANGLVRAEIALPPEFMAVVQQGELVVFQQLLDKKPRRRKKKDAEDSEPS